MEDDVYYLSDICPYLTSEEDYNLTTLYSKCSCGYVYCNQYDGYCPVRD